MDAHTFLKRIEHTLRCDAGRAEAVTFAVFQELRDRLTPSEAADVAAQLPTALKTMWLEGEVAGRNVSRIDAAEFIGRVRRRAVLVDDIEAERAVLAVFAALQGLLGSASGREGESWDVLSQLPKSLKELWVTAADRTAATKSQ